MKYEKRAPKNEAPSFYLADFIAGKLLLSRAYVLFKPAREYKKFSNQSHQLFLTTLPMIFLDDPSQNFTNVRLRQFVDKVHFLGNLIVS